MPPCGGKGIVLYVVNQDNGFCPHILGTMFSGHGTCGQAPRCSLCSCSGRRALLWGHWLRSRCSCTEAISARDTGLGLGRLEQNPRAQAERSTFLAGTDRWAGLLGCSRNRLYGTQPLKPRRVSTFAALLFEALGESTHECPSSISSQIFCARVSPHFLCSLHIVERRRCHSLRPILRKSR